MHLGLASSLLLVSALTIAAAGPSLPLAANVDHHSHHHRLSKRQAQPQAAVARRSSSGSARAARRSSVIVDIEDRALMDLGNGPEVEKRALEGLTGGLGGGDLLGGAGAGNLLGGAGTKSLDITALIGNLKGSSTGMRRSQQDMHKYARKVKASRSSRSSGAIQHEIAEKLKEYRAQSGAIPVLTQLGDATKPLGPDMGLTNYDPNNQIEVYLKDIVNSMKYLLSDVDLIVYEIPILGPVLGPIVYDIKCIIDHLLNGSEIIIDGLLNQLGIGTQLNVLSAEYLVSVCKMGPSLPVC